MAHVKSNKTILIVVTLVVLLLTYLIASPYFALYQIKKAIQAKDADKVSQYVDYPSLRQSVKDQMNGYMMKELSTKAKDDKSGMAAAGALLASTMVNSMVDGLVTPQGLKMAFNGKSMNPMANTTDQPTQTPNKLANFNDSYDTQMGYKSINQFYVTLNDKKQANNSMDVILERDGLSWKIKAVQLPMDNN